MILIYNPTRTALLFLILVLIFAGNLPAVEISHSPLQPLDSPEGRGVSLFIATQPFGARVSLDGVEIEGRTPLVVGLPEQGTRIVGIRMTGYRDIEESLIIEEGSVTVLSAELEQTGSGVYFEDGAAFEPDGGELPPGGYSLDQGRYDFAAAGGLVSASPVYPNQQWIDGLNIAIPIITVFTGALMISEAVSPRTENRISPFSISALITDILLIGGNVGLHVHRSKWRESWKADPVEARPETADKDLREAEEALESGDIALARNLYDRFAMLYPMNRNTPEALYRSARLAYLQMDNSICRDRLANLFGNYPVPEFWDLSRRLEADLAFREERIRDGLDALDLIYGLSPGVNLEAIAYKKAEILTGIADETGEAGDLRNAAAAWNNLLTRWPLSDQADEYRRALSRLE